MIDGKVNVTLSIEEVNYYNELEERDEAKAVVKKEYKTISHDPSYLCPACKTITIEGDKFCRECGQRIDRSNIAL